MKGKEGEFAALEALGNDVRPLLVPLVEVPEVPYDYTNDRPAKSLDDHVAGVADRLRKCRPGRPFFLDLPWFEDEHLANGRIALEKVPGDCRVIGQLTIQSCV